MKGENHIIIEKNQDLLVFLVGFVVAFLGGGGGGRRRAPRSDRRRGTVPRRPRRTQLQVRSMAGRGHGGIAAAGSRLIRTLGYAFFAPIVDERRVLGKNEQRPFASDE